MLDKDDTPFEFPHRAGRFASAPHIVDQIRACWADGQSCFTEVLLVADQGGVLFELDPDRLWAGLEEAAAAPPRYEPLASETPDDRTCFRARRASLHEEEAVRARWLRLLRDVWAAIEPGWVREGRDVVDAAAWEMQSRLPAVGSYTDLVPFVQSNDFHGLLPRLVGEAARADQQMVLVPTWLGCKGYLITLPDRLVWGPPDPSHPAGPSAATRDRARRHKALGDPTRLAIFEATARRPRHVGELARELAVAQPTDSNHVRILRDAGFVAQEKAGARRLVADVARFERFLDESRRSVVPPAPATAASR
jgi:DNA-binding transcriptional ArsR family regulator